MAEILKSVTNPQVSGSGLIDIAGMLVVKRLVDAVSMPYIGNNNLVSAVAKTALGGVFHGKGGRIGHIVTGGVVLDGVDDLAGVVMGKLNIGRGAAAQTAAVNPGL